MGRATLLAGFMLAGVLGAQTPHPLEHSSAPAEVQGPSPLYRVNVIDSSTMAVNYSARGTASKVAFRGTVLLRDAKGEARVRNRQGAIEVDARIEGLEPPGRFGEQYLTYVAWALTPQGRATNLGQLVPDHKNRARLRTSTELQTFALIVTAEPYHAVTQPSNVVVLENIRHAETYGRIEQIAIAPELLHRGEIDFDPSAAERYRPNTGRVKLDVYEALLELNQAKNALYLAQSANAHGLAASAYGRAEDLYRTASQHYEGKRYGDAVAVARQATQTAEDARLVALERTRERSPAPPAAASGQE
ncbi:MAG: hypothetical protein IPM24_19075 [Bryobacterales bacterium]|nr:hypothetical protein [Bryobacterales bacterium]